MSKENELIEGEDYSQYDAAVLESNIEININNYSVVNKISSKFNSLKDSILEEFKKTAISFVKIGFYLSEIDDLFKNDDAVSFNDFGYVDIWDFAKQEFNISRTSALRMINVSKTFFENNYGYPTVKKQYEGYNYSQLCELLSINENHLGLFNPNMAVKEIRNNKVKLKLDEFKAATFMKKASSIRCNITMLLTEPDKLFTDNDLEKEYCKQLGEFSFNSEVVERGIDRYGLNINCYYRNFKKTGFKIQIDLWISNDKINENTIIDFYHSSPWTSFSEKINSVSIDTGLIKFLKKYLNFLFVVLVKDKEDAKIQKEKDAANKEKLLLESSLIDELENKFKAENKFYVDLNYKDYKKDINKISRYKNSINDCKKLYNINDNSIILFTSNMNLYVKINDDYYMYVSDSHYNRNNVYALAGNYMSSVYIRLNSYEAISDYVNLLIKYKE